MAKKIGFVVQSGNQVKVYDENNSYMFPQTGTLTGFTSTCVSVLKNGRTTVYGNRNVHKCTH